MGMARRKEPAEAKAHLPACAVSSANRRPCHGKPWGAHAASQNPALVLRGTACRRGLCLRTLPLWPTPAGEPQASPASGPPRSAHQPGLGVPRVAGVTGHASGVALGLPAAGAHRLHRALAQGAAVLTRTSSLYLLRLNVRGTTDTPPCRSARASHSLGMTTPGLSPGSLRQPHDRAWMDGYGHPEVQMTKVRTSVTHCWGGHDPQPQIVPLM